MWIQVNLISCSSQTAATGAAGESGRCIPGIHDFLGDILGKAGLSKKKKNRKAHRPYSDSDHSQTLRLCPLTQLMSTEREREREHT